MIGMCRLAVKLASGPFMHYANVKNAPYEIRYFKHNWLYASSQKDSTGLANRYYVSCYMSSIKAPALPLTASDVGTIYIHINVTDNMLCTWLWGMNAAWTDITEGYHSPDTVTIKHPDSDCVGNHELRFRSKGDSIEPSWVKVKAK
jgi:hypothetical protein